MMKKLLPVFILFIIAACNDTGKGEHGEDPPAITSIPAPQNIVANIISVYPHDTSAYTQGLQVHDGKLYEGTGDFERSSLRISDIKTGKVIKKHMMGSEDVFGEGINIFNGKIYQLTWQNHKVNVYDLNNIDNPIKIFDWPYEGWGITNNGKDLIISDGSANLYFVNAEDFKVKNKLQIIDNVGPVDNINELEYIDGYVYANIYLADYIVKIDPSNGHVVGRISLPGLIQQYAPGYQLKQGEVLNGIAYDSTNKKIYITGKDWPKLFEVTLTQ